VVVREDGPFLLIDAFGRGFLYGMVRAIAGTLLEVGLGKRDPGSMEEMLGSLDRNRAGFTAPARGLCLISVYYRNGEMEAALETALVEGQGGSGRGGSDALPEARVLKLFRQS